MTPGAFSPKRPGKWDVSHPHQTCMPCNHPGKKQPLEDSASCGTLPGNGTSETVWRDAFTPSALGMSLPLSRSSTWSCICFESVLVQKPLSVPQVFFQLVLPGAEGDHTNLLQPWLPQVVIVHQKEMVWISKHSSLKVLPSICQIQSQMSQTGKLSYKYISWPPRSSSPLLHWGTGHS